MKWILSVVAMLTEVSELNQLAIEADLACLCMCIQEQDRRCDATNMLNCFLNKGRKLSMLLKILVKCKDADMRGKEKTITIRASAK
jgi:aminoglycoside phosphotransferase family enzyme